MNAPHIVLHPRTPRSVAKAFATADDLDLVIPAIEDLVEALSVADVFVSSAWRDEFLQPTLRWVQSISVGVDQFPTDDLERAGVALTSAKGCHGPQVSEHAFALLLAMTRGIGLAMRNAEARSWRPIQGTELAGSTIGILGLGTIGNEIAMKAAAWGMEVVGTKANPADYSGVASRVFGPDETMRVFEIADAVISVLPDLESTRGIVTTDCLAALAGGWFVNVGRGTAVNETDLLWALDDGGLAGAGLDVFDPEPLSEDSPLWSHPRVVITAHSAGFSPHYGSRLMEIFRTNLGALTGRGDWVNRVV